LYHRLAVSWVLRIGACDLHRLNGRAQHPDGGGPGRVAPLHRVAKVVHELLAKSHNATPGSRDLPETDPRNCTSPGRSGRDRAPPPSPSPVEGEGNSLPLPPLRGKVGMGGHPLPHPPPSRGRGILCPFPPCGGRLGWSPPPSPSPVEGRGLGKRLPPLRGKVGMGGHPLPHPPPSRGRGLGKRLPPLRGKVGMGGAWTPSLTLPRRGGGEFSAPSPLAGEGWDGGVRTASKITSATEFGCARTSLFQNRISV